MMVPSILAMVICDAVWREPVSGKVSMLGAFSRVAADEVPVELNQVCVYLLMSGYRGQITLRVTVVPMVDDGEDDAVPLAATEVAAEFGDRLEIVDGAATLYNVDLPTFGGYTLKLWAGETLLESRRLSVEPRW